MKSKQKARIILQHLSNVMPVKSKKATMFRSYKKNHNHKTYEVIKNGKCVYIAKFPEPQKGVK